MSKLQNPKKGFKKIKWYFGKEIQIPEEWKWEKISDHLTIKGRIGWEGLTTREYLQKGEFHLVTGIDFKNGKIDWDKCVFVNKDRFIQDENIQLKIEDVLVTKDGTIGKIAYIDSVPLPATLNTGVFVVRKSDEEVIPLYLYYVLNSNYFIKFLNRLKAGSTISHLYQKDFINFKFPIPPYEEQKRITDILSNLDNLIKLYDAMIEQNMRLKQGMMQELFTKGIGHKKFKKIKWYFGKEIQIPEEWKITGIFDICHDIFLGLTTKVDYVESDGIPLIRANNVSSGNLLFNKAKQISKKQHEFLTRYHKPKRGDVLVTKSGSLGVCAIVDSDKEFSIYESIISLQPNKKFLISKYLLYVLRENEVQNRLKSDTVGSVVKHINLIDFRKIKIPLPSIHEQKKITDILESIDNKIQVLESKNFNFKNLKKGLMQKLLTGTIRVKV